MKSCLKPVHAGLKKRKKFRKYQKGKEFIEAVISVLEQNISDKEYKDYSEFEGMLKNLIGNIEGMTPSRLTAIAMELSVMDKTAVVQKDKKREYHPRSHYQRH